MPTPATNPRTLLFVPGNQLRMLGKARDFDIDWLIPDLEDSVPHSEKLEARRIVSEQIPALAAAGKFLAPRVNSLSTGLTADDINAMVSPYIVGISIGKISFPEEAIVIDKMLASAEEKAGVPVGQIALLPWLETAGAVINAYQICKATDRIRWAAFGAEDFSADMGISRSVDTSGAGNSATASEVEHGLTYPRSAVAVAARAAGVHVLDTPYTKFRDPNGLRAEAMLAKSIGYKGKLSIHPAQVEIIDSVFKPTDLEIARAQRVVDVAAEAESGGRGSVSLDGEMIDMPVILRAQNVLRDAGLLD